jgi:hypothetical protein
MVDLGDSASKILSPKSTLKRRRKIMNVKELREMLANLPDDLEGFEFNGAFGSIKVVSVVDLAEHDPELEPYG